MAMEIWGRRILQQYPYDADIITSVAADLMQKNKIDSARQLTMRYLETDTTNFNVWHQYAYSCYLLGDYTEAQRSYLKLYRQGWKGGEVSLILGICYSEMNDDNNAYNHLVRANQMKSGRDVLVLKLLAKNCMKIGMPKESAEYMKQAIGLSIPDSLTLSGMYNSLAEAYFYLHDYEHAISSFQKASKCQPTNAITYYNIAQMYSGLKDSVGMTNYYALFLKHSSTLKDTESNREMIEKAKAFVKKSK
jgi:tetratricopeptide (TPR) repeat protein